jgi:hypothetical protein
MQQNNVLLLSSVGTLHILHTFKVLLLKDIVKAYLDKYVDNEIPTEVSL